MDRTAIRHLLIERISARARRLGLDEGDLTDGFDLVRSGVLDSLGFVDLLTDLERAAGRQVDLESTIGTKGATTVNGVLTLFERS